MCQVTTPARCAIYTAAPIGTPNPQHPLRHDRGRGKGKMAKHLAKGASMHSVRDPSFGLLQDPCFCNCSRQQSGHRTKRLPLFRGCRGFAGVLKVIREKTKSRRVASSQSSGYYIIMVFKENLHLKSLKFQKGSAVVSQLLHITLKSMINCGGMGVQSGSSYFYGTYIEKPGS